jgi:hypothetical protein
MRYTKNGEIPDGGGNSRGIMPEPRFGFAYDLFGTHKTILRGGAGMTHDRVQGNLIFNTVFNNPALVQTAQVAANNVANLPSLGGDFGNFVQGDRNIIGAARDGKVPTVYSFSFGIQHEIAKGTTIDLAYVGTLSRHLVTGRDINAVPFGYAFTAAAQDPNNFSGGVVPAVEPDPQWDFPRAQPVTFCATAGCNIGICPCLRTFLWANAFPFNSVWRRTTSSTIPTSATRTTVQASTGPGSGRIQEQQALFKGAMECRQVAPATRMSLFRKAATEDRTRIPITRVAVLVAHV